ncbi:MAG: hypothetical protein ACLR2G_04285 [Phascolarctobacterium faecium]
MLTKLPAQNKIAAFDIDAQNTFTPVCPDELPVAEGDQIVEELNAQAALASLRIGSRDAHSPQAVWIAGNGHPVLSPVSGYPDVDVYWPAHAIVGTKGFEFITGLDPKNYDFQVYKGIEIDKHPYGACYHDLANTLSTGAIEYLREHGITTVICGGLATDYHVKILFYDYVPRVSRSPEPAACANVPCCGGTRRNACPRRHDCRKYRRIKETAVSTQTKRTSICSSFFHYYSYSFCHTSIPRWLGKIAGSNSGSTIPARF